MKPGDMLGPYRVVFELGAGGMGEVYRARDTKLERDVALKLLPESFASDPDRRMRFEREAKTLASLNHPNIAAIYGLEDNALVMELVEGKTLDEVIPLQIGDRRSPIEHVEWALTIATQVASALQSAHDSGIVHRDLKPANIKVRDDGTVKVLDFGLAKALDQATGSGDQGSGSAAMSATMTSPAMTAMGMILGTAAYMSPEQARGRPVDQRADIWAFGVVLFEMLTGRRLFEGDTVSDTLAAVLREEIPWDRLPRDLPATVRRVLGRCLERDPGKRLRDIGDARLDLEDTTTDAPASAPAVRPRPAGPRLTERALWALALVAVATPIWFLRPGPARPWDTFTQVTDAAGLEDFPAIAPDGNSVAYVSDAAGTRDIYVQRIGGRTRTLVAGAPDLEETAPAFSPDGQRIAYNLATGAGGIFIVGATGESPRRLTDEGFHPAWSPDGQSIAYCTEQVVSPYGRNRTASLWTIAVDDASAVAVKLTDGDAVQPAWSPHGQRIAYWVAEGGQRDIYTIAATGGERTPVLQDAPLDWSPVWSPDGEYLYFSSDRGGSMNLWRIGIDESTGDVRGAPEPVTTGVQAQASLPSFSADGRRMVFRSLLTSVNPVAIPFDPATATTGEPRFLFRQTGIRTPTSLSPDGQTLLYQNVGERREDLFMGRVGSADLTRLTDDDARDRWPVWSPDGREMVFYSNREDGKYALWTIRRDGSGLTRISDPAIEQGMSYGVYSADGSRLFSSTLEGGGVFSFDLSGPRPAAATELTPVESSFFWLTALSPDGRTLAGSLERNGDYRAVTYDIATGAVITLPATVEGVGGSWLPDGRVMYQPTARSLAVVDVATGVVRTLGPWPFEVVTDAPVFSPDGRTIYVGGGETAADVWMVERRRD